MNKFLILIGRLSTIFLDNVFPEDLEFLILIGRLSTNNVVRLLVIL